MGFSVSQHGQLGAMPPPPFLSVSPWSKCEVEVRYTPPLKRGISAILARYPMKTRQMGAIPPIARYGGVSRIGPLRSLLCFSCTEIHDWADQKLFWRGPEHCREGAFSWYVFHLLNTFCPPPPPPEGWGLEKFVPSLESSFPPVETQGKQISSPGCPGSFLLG